MPSERVQRVIDGYLDEIEVAAKDGRWNDVSELANTILELDDTNDDAQTFLKLAVSKSGGQETHSVNDSVAENNPTDGVSAEQKKSNHSHESISPVNNESLLDSLEHWYEDNKADSNFETSESMIKFVEESHQSFSESTTAPLDGTGFTVPIIRRLLQASDQELVSIVAEDLKELENAMDRSNLKVFFSGSGIGPSTKTRLRLAHLLIRLRKEKEGAELDVEKKTLTPPPPKEPESEYWRKQQGLEPLANQGLATLQSPPHKADTIIENDAPNSLGGWLILVGLGLIVRPVILISEAISSFDVLGYPGYYLTSDEEAFYTLYGFSCLIFLGANVVLAFLYFGKKQSFPNVYVGMLCAAIAWYLLAWVWSANVLSSELVSYYAFDAVLVLVTSVPWILYMKESKQVKATFTR